MFWGKKNEDKQEDGNKQNEEGTSTNTVASTKVGTGVSAAVEQQDAFYGLPEPTSVFEFGPTVNAGQDLLRGVCTGDDPDAIQACTWTIEEVTGRPKDKKHQYRIEF